MAIVTSIFGQLAQSHNIQGLVDSAKAELNARTSFRQFLSYGAPQIQLTFESVIGRQRIAAAASIVDEDSPAPLRSRQHLEILQGKIPTMKEKIPLTQKDYRDLEMLRALLKGDQLNDELVSLLENDLKTVALSTDYRMEYMFLQGISTLAIDISVISNPDGAALGLVQLLPDATERAKHFKKVGVSWADQANADPIDDIRKVVSEVALSSGVIFSEIWMSQDRLWEVLNTKAVKQYISGLATDSAVNKFVVTEDMLNGFLRGNRLPEIRVINQVIGVEQVASRDDLGNPIKYQAPFKTENVVFVPAGRLGTIQHAISVEDRNRNDAKNYAKYDKALLMKWRENEPWREYTGVELHAFPALDAIDSIYVLETRTTA